VGVVLRRKVSMPVLPPDETTRYYAAMKRGLTGPELAQAAGLRPAPSFVAPPAPPPGPRTWVKHAQPPVATGTGSDAYWQNFENTYRDLPLNQAQQALNAAIQYQIMRGVQKDLEAGLEPAKAMAKWATVGALSRLGAGGASAGLASMMKNLTPQPPVELTKEPIAPGSDTYIVRTPDGKFKIARATRPTDETEKPLTPYQRLTGEIRKGQLVQQSAIMPPESPGYSALTNTIARVEKLLDQPGRPAAATSTPAATPAKTNAPSLPWKEGAIVRSKVSNKQFRVQNGKLVELKEEEYAR